MKRVILCPNPYRDSELTMAKRSRELLEGLGFETVVCLPFSREGYDDQLGVPIRQLQQEIKRADMLIAFGDPASGPDSGAAQCAGAGHQSGEPWLYVRAGAQRAGTAA